MRRGLAAAALGAVIAVIAVAVAGCQLDVELAPPVPDALVIDARPIGDDADAPSEPVDAAPLPDASTAD